MDGNETLNIFRYGEDEIRRGAGIEVAPGAEVRPLACTLAEKWLEASEVVKRIEGVEIPAAESAVETARGTRPLDVEELQKATHTLMEVKRRHAAETRNLVDQYFSLMGAEKVSDKLTFTQCAGALTVMQSFSDPLLASGMYVRSLAKMAGSARTG